MTLQAQGDNAAEPEDRASVLPSMKLDDVKDDEIIADCKPKGSDSNEEPPAQEEKEESKSEYANMELPRNRTPQQCMMHLYIYQWIQHAHTTQGPEIMPRH